MYILAAIDELQNLCEEGDDQTVNQVSNTSTVSQREAKRMTDDFEYETGNTIAVVQNETTS